MAKNNYTYALNSDYGYTPAFNLDEINAAIKKFENLEYTIPSLSIGTYGLGKVSNEPSGEAEWVWVTGYKATNKDMQCRNYQFELNKQHDMPENTPIIMCSSGFHFCDKLNKTFSYYYVQDGNRYFEVRALVRRWKKDCCYAIEQENDKMVAKSIILTRELTIDEIFDAFKEDEFKSWTTEQKEQARQSSIAQTRNAIKIKKLIELGYSEAFAAYAVEKCVYDIAYTMGMTPNVSMDIKVLAVCMRIRY